MSTSPGYQPVCRSGFPDRPGLRRSEAAPCKGSIVRACQVGTLILQTAVLLGMTMASSSAQAVPERDLTPPAPYASRDRSFSMRKEAAAWIGGKTVATVYWEYHAPPDRWRIEFLAPKTARGRVMIQRKSTIWQWEPSRGAVFVTKGDLPIDDAERIVPLISRNYRIHTDRPDSIEAGHKCHVLRLTPKFRGKPKWLLWVDRETGMILKRERYGSHGELEMASHCLEFRLTPVSPAKFDPKSLPKGSVISRRRQRVPSSRSELRRLIGITPPVLLKGGFRLHSMSTLPDQPKTAHITYSDGIVTLSMFASRGSRLNAADLRKGRHMHIGNSDAVASDLGQFTSVSWLDDGFVYTLVGEVSQQAITEIARSVAR